MIITTIMIKTTIKFIFPQVWTFAAGDPPPQDGQGRHGGGALLQVFSSNQQSQNNPHLAGETVLYQQTGFHQRDKSLRTSSPGRRWARRTSRTSSSTFTSVTNCPQSKKKPHSRMSFYDLKRRELLIICPLLLWSKRQ